MGFKVDSSFLRFLTMGAMASQRVIQLMKHQGLQPIELERYSASNKIWSTKVKRLRLPDLLCVRTGLRVEVRAKSDLAIRMSDAPANPDRRWHSGLVDDDMVAFVKCSVLDDTVTAAPNAELFFVSDLRSCDESLTKLGPPKSASEGSERDREWPTTVPNSDGEVFEVTTDVIRTRLANGRAQSYKLKGRTPYVQPGDRFVAKNQFLAGLPSRKADFSAPPPSLWNPRPLITGSPVDRYVLAKALSHIGTPADLPLLNALASDQTETRVSLEALGSLAKIGAREGLDSLIQEVRAPRLTYLRMEAVLILSEFRDTPLQMEAAEALQAIAGDPTLRGDEVRQAALWGLGHAGLNEPQRLIPFLAADDVDERIHAMVALGQRLNGQVASQLVALLGDDTTSPSARAAAAHILSRASTWDIVLRETLPLASNGSATGRAWARVVLGALPPAILASANIGNDLTEQLLPLQLTAPMANWTRQDLNADQLGFVQRQTVSLATR